MPPQSNQFTQFLKEKAGDSLRLVVEFTDDAYTAEYVRRDIAQRYSNDEIHSIIDDACEYADITHSDTVIEAAGDLHCQVVCFENVVSLVFPRAQANMPVNLDPTAAQNLHSFASACTNVLQE
ncbi:hypothetical protein DJ71_01615 [Halorubrum sp. E3]|nr:hypothetical protein DJ71_01615 [Halorubrum sp. E3]